MLNDLYYGKRNKFYYIELKTKDVLRDDAICEILGLDYNISYITNAYTNISTRNLHFGRFWKDKPAALDGLKRASNRAQIPGKLVEVNEEQFINLIPDITFELTNKKSSDIQLILSELKCGHDEAKNYLRSFEEKRKQLNHIKQWDNHVKSYYKCTRVYTKVEDPQNWEKCKKCGLIPLIWEFDNGRSTACGCGENEYVHFSIQAESIMSYIKRNNGSALDFKSGELKYNWNHYQKTGINLYEQIRQENINIY